VLRHPPLRRACSPRAAREDRLVRPFSQNSPPTPARLCRCAAQAKQGPSPRGLDDIQ
jgi:hypothetical protein